MKEEKRSESTLMKKTKKELIDIILRKDDVEIRLKDNIKTLEEDVKGLETRIVGYDADINCLTAKLHDADVVEAVIRKSNKTLKKWIVALSAALITAIIVAVIL